MRETEKLVQMIGMSRRAGALIMGFDSVLSSVKEKKIQTVFLLNNASAKTKKEVNFYAEKTSTKVIELPLSMEELHPILGRKVAVLGVSQESLANRIVELSDEIDRRNVDGHTI